MLCSGRGENAQKARFLDQDRGETTGESAFKPPAVSFQLRRRILSHMHYTSDLVPNWEFAN
jgi:hypothetical protein